MKERTPNRYRFNEGCWFGGCPQPVAEVQVWGQQGSNILPNTQAYCAEHSVLIKNEDRRYFGLKFIWHPVIREPFGGEFHIKMDHALMGFAENLPRWIADITLTPEEELARAA